MHHPHPPRVRAPFVDTLAAAVHVVDASITGDRFGTFVLLLDGDDRLLTVVELADAAHDVDALVAASVAFLDAAASTSSWAATVLASDRTGAGALATCDDRAGWAELRAAFGDAGVALVDWLLLDGDVIGSLAGQVDGIDVWSTG